MVGIIANESMDQWRMWWLGASKSMDQVDLYLMEGVKAVMLDQFDRLIDGTIDRSTNWSIDQWFNVLIDWSTVNWWMIGGRYEIKQLINDDYELQWKKSLKNKNITKWIILTLSYQIIYEQKILYLPFSVLTADIIN